MHYPYRCYALRQFIRTPYRGDSTEGRRLIGATVGGLGRGSEVPLIFVHSTQRMDCETDARGGKGQLDQVPLPPFLLRHEDEPRIPVSVSERVGQWTVGVSMDSSSRSPYCRG